MKTLPKEGRSRVVIEQVWPQIDGGRFPVKRVQGDSLTVEANLIADGHDAIAAVIRYRPKSAVTWQEAPLYSRMDGSDRWWGTFSVSEIGPYLYTIQGWIDHFATWQQGFVKKAAADQDLTVELQLGRSLIQQTLTRCPEQSDRHHLEGYLAKIDGFKPADSGALVELLSGEAVRSLMQRYPDRSFASTYGLELELWIDRKRAEFSTWYEFFPRSCGQPNQHGTFRDAIERLPYVADMGFDVVYLPPIHPIGQQFRKGKNNAVAAEPDDVGVPWGIGSLEGGHKAIHPELGTLADFQALVAAAQGHGLEIALDLAYQCSPDHPYVRENPQWFKHRPDGTIQYAENPPKKYQDIYPLDFETDDWENLWQELKSVVLFWVAQGVKIFRVDNPHTKSLAFWEWVIAEVHDQDPEVLFLAEAFTRPTLMYRLAKLGFSQSYTYFTWRNHKQELIDYMVELTQTSVQDFFRPNFWPNTPDILHAYLQQGGRPAFVIRLVLAATLTSNYGIYGPAYEVCENRAVREGSEEYLNSEKYQLRSWDLDSPYSIQDFVTRLNWARREHLSLQTNRALRFHYVNNSQILCYSKQTSDYQDVMLVVVSLNPHEVQMGYVDLPLESLGLDPAREYKLHDILNLETYTWFGGHNYIELHPHWRPAHVFWIEQ